MIHLQGFKNDCVLNGQDFWFDCTNMNVTYIINRILLIFRDGNIIYARGELRNKPRRNRLLLEKRH